MAKKIPPNSLVHRPLCNLAVVSSFSAEKNEEDVPLSDRQQKMNSSCSSSRCRLQAVILLFQAHVSYLSPLIFFFSLSHSQSPPDLSLLSLPPDLSLFSLPFSLCSPSLLISLCSLPGEGGRQKRSRDKAERDRKGGKAEREEGREIEGRESREIRIKYRRE